MSTICDDLLPDLLAEILYRLPVESLLVCKSVSKTWWNLISDPHFVRTHLLCSSKKAKAESTQFVMIYYFRVTGGTRLYMLKDKPELVSSSSLSLPPPPSPWNQRVEFPEYRVSNCSPQPCRGLLCFTTQFPLEKANDKITIVAVNPATRQFHELPKLGPIEDPKALTYGLSYIVFDSSSNTYKVLWLSMINYGKRNVRKMVSVINLANDVSWRKVTLPSDANRCSCWAFPSLHHGVPYMFNTLSGVEKSLILVFDAEHENFLAFTFFHAGACTPNPSLRTMAACQGSIYVFCTWNNTTTNKVVDVWVMKDYKVSETWVRESSSNLQFLYKSPSYSKEAGRYLANIEVHGVIDHEIFLKIQTGWVDEAYVIYDSINKVFKRHEKRIYEIEDKEQVLAHLKPYENPELIRNVTRGEFYESLVSPRLGY